MENVYLLPEDLHFDLVMTRYSTQVSTIMSENLHDPLGPPSDTDRLQIMRRLEEEFDALSNDFGPNPSC